MARRRRKGRRIPATSSMSISYGMKTNAHTGGMMGVTRKFDRGKMIRIPRPARIKRV